MYREVVNVVGCALGQSLQTMALYAYLDFCVAKVVLNYVIPSGLTGCVLMFSLPLQLKTCENVFQMYVMPSEETVGCMKLKLYCDLTFSPNIMCDWIT